MLKRIWQWLKSFFQQLFGTSSQPSQKRRGSLPDASGERGVEPPPELTDADLEFLFMQLLEGVHQGRGQDWAIKWLNNIEHRVSTERWVEWLRRFGDRLLGSPAANNELAARMVQLGDLRIGEVGDVAYETGMRLLTRNPVEPIWEYGGPDAEPPTPVNEEGEEGELKTVTLDELLVMLHQDESLRQMIAQQLGIETDDPEVIIEALINQFNAANQ